MRRDLYYCTMWKHRAVSVGSKEYSICISPKIDGNDAGTTIQYHGIIVNNGKVVRVGSICNSSDNSTLQQKLTRFEAGFQDVVRAVVTWNDDIPDKGVVKVWYYEEEGDSMPTNITYLPLRFAVTIVGIIPLSDPEGCKLRDTLQNTTVDWLRSCLKMR